MPNRDPETPDEAATLEHTTANRRKIQAAYVALRKAGRGRIMGDVSVGYDHTKPDPTNRWWSRVDVAGVAMQGHRVRYVPNGRGGHMPLQEVLVEGYPSAVDALEAMGQRLSALLRLN